MEKKLDTEKTLGTYAAVAHQDNTITLTERPSSRPEPPCQPVHRELKSFIVQIKDTTNTMGICRVARMELLSQMKIPSNSHITAIMEICQMASGDLLVGTTIVEV